MNLPNCIIKVNILYSYEMWLKFEKQNCSNMIVNMWKSPILTSFNGIHVHVCAFKGANVLTLRMQIFIHLC